jgi:hypothetical protein
MKIKIIKYHLQQSLPHQIIVGETSDGTFIDLYSRNSKIEPWRANNEVHRFSRATLKKQIEAGWKLVKQLNEKELFIELL